MQEGKENLYNQLEKGQWECLVCAKELSTKQRVFTHLHTRHGCSPLKRVKKQYIENEDFEIPRSTLYWQNKRKVLRSLDTGITDKDCPVDDLGGASESSLNHQNDHDDACSFRSQQIQSTCSNDNLVASNQESVAEAEKDSLSHADTEFLPSTVKDSESSNSHSDSLKIEVDSDNYNSDNDALSFTDFSSDSDSSFEINWDTNSESDFCTDIPSDDGSEVGISSVQPDVNTADQALSLMSCFLMSCFLRNRLSTSACRDVIETLKATFKNSEEISALSYNKIVAEVDTSPVHETHYCTQCYEIFPSDKNIFQCQKPTCDGLRYKGPLAVQDKGSRQPRQSFIFADVKTQLVTLLETQGIWQDIQNSKEDAFDRLEFASGVISDIVDGSAYRAMMGETGFLHKASHNLTGVFNTDGVNLFSSSKTDLWPIYLAINELSPAKRFARENIILVGIWQGKGKPPINQFFKVFVQTMNSLYIDGVDVQIDEELVRVRLSVVCCIADLPAKAELLNMSYFNGPYACITCEEEGQTVKQGKGCAKCYAYKVHGDRSNPRTQDTVIDHMSHGTSKNRSKGFKGNSALSSLQNYNIVDGTVPEYMHGVLLGVTKTLMTKWFSPLTSKKDYFIGNHLKEISSRMSSLKPPEGIERLPRDLEKNYSHFKASELQSWLLYYGFPCLNGFLQDEYLEHFSYFSEAIHLLLRDEITSEMLLQAEELLDQFYSSFQRLYGDGSCGLNVHNVGLHLSHYVRLWGPLWAWSAFPFEDSNSAILQSVHGTGNVLKQAMKYRQVQYSLRRKGLIVKKPDSRKVTHIAANCDIVGAAKPVKPEEIENEVVQHLNQEHDTVLNITKVDRVIVNGKMFYSEQYSRMKKRVCCVVLFANDKIGTIKYFILFQDNAYAVVSNMHRIPREQMPGVHFPNHYIAVRNSDLLSVVDVTYLKKVLVYLFINGNDFSYVVSMPNGYGHAVFK